MKIYAASSWRNASHEHVVKMLQAEDHDVYNFRCPSECPLPVSIPNIPDEGFSWSDIDPKWRSWGSKQFILSLEHSAAKRGFDIDMHAMRWAEACVLVLPCGRSAHLEAGWFVGNGKPLFILGSIQEPELMYSMATHICLDIGTLLNELGTWRV